MFITLTGIQGACIYINPEHIAAMPYTGGGKTPVYCATSGAHYQVLETPEQILALIEAEKRKELRDEFAGKEDLHEVELTVNDCNVLAGRALRVGMGIIEQLQWEADWRAALKYIRADAMLKAREGK